MPDHGEHPQRRPFRRLTLVSVGVVLALVAFELVLQVLAVVAWLSSEGGATPRQAGLPVALCLGDSFTYGLGATATDRAYPAQAQAATALLGTRVAFVNRGWPGQTSRDVLATLRTDLDRDPAQLVYLLIGTNDFHFRPEQLDVAEAESGGRFVLRWRTYRFFELLLRPTEDRAAEPVIEPSSEPFLGVWHAEDVQLELTADGVMRLAGLPYRWFRDGQGRLLMEDVSGWRLPLRLERVGRGLRMERTAWWSARDFEPGAAPPPTAEELAWRLLRTGQTALAHQAFVQLAAVDGGAFSVRAGLVASGAADGADGSTATVLAALEVEHSARPYDPRMTLDLAWALRAAGRERDAVALTLTLLEDLEHRSAALDLIERVAPTELRAWGLATDVRAVADRAMPGTPWSGRLLRAWFVAEHTADHGAALKGLARAIGRHADSDFWMDWLRGTPVRVSPVALFEACMFVPLAFGQETLSLPSREFMDRLRRRMEAGTEATIDVLCSHVRALAAECASRGTRVVLLDYPGGPFAKRAHDRALRVLAAEDGLEVLSVRAAFDAIPAATRAEYYVADGHCSDRGYALIGRLVAEHAVAALAVTGRSR